MQPPQCPSGGQHDPSCPAGGAPGPDPTVPAALRGGLVLPQRVPGASWPAEPPTPQRTPPWLTLAALLNRIAELAPDIEQRDPELGDR
jgi:hypothetical protein